jgi:ribonuclease VapC
VIVVDSSAVIAIFRQEDDAAHYARCIAADDDPIISAANIVETSIVLRGLKKIAPDRAERWLDEFIETAGIRIESITREQAAIARSAHPGSERGPAMPRR